ncbi:MAG: sulfatase-like hydrolase/transferase [Opitutales bacterium]|jgi:arylsulfatase A-like enzyme|nr:sulfatase-like hydrolase/transferase [Opitutales bacterium]
MYEKVLLLVSLLSAALNAASSNPNVILILADDLGIEALGCYGGTSYETPNLDRLAAEGVRFDDAHAVPLCTPTRVSLMTGKYGFRNWLAFGILDPKARTFGHWFSDAGYKTCIAGKWQLRSYNPPEYMPEWRNRGMRAEDSGFDEYFLWHTEHTEDKASRYANPRIQTNGPYVKNTEDQYGPDLYVDFINDFIERNQEEQFFVYYPMALTHGPFNPTPDSYSWSTGDRFESDPGKYFGDMVDYMDKMIGRIDSKLSELGIRENTLLIFYGDNGTPKEVVSKMIDGRSIRGGKGENNRRGTHVPLVVNWPAAQSGGRVVSDLVDTSDFVPSILDAAKIELPKNEAFDGRSFIPQVMGDSGEPRDWIYIHHDPLPGHKKIGRSIACWIQDKRYKLYDDTRNNRFHDFITDPEELYPIDLVTTNAETKAAHGKLRTALASLDR